MANPDFFTKVLNASLTSNANPLLEFSGGTGSAFLFEKILFMEEKHPKFNKVYEAFGSMRDYDAIIRIITNKLNSYEKFQDLPFGKRTDVVTYIAMVFLNLIDIGN